MTRALILAAIVGLAGCGGPEDRSLRQELRRHSAESGLALIQVDGDRAAVIPFDSGDRYFDLNYRQPLTTVVGRDGRAVAWCGHPLLPSIIDGKDDDPARLGRAILAGNLVVETIDGSPLAQDEIASDSEPIALNAQARLLAFAGNPAGSQTQPGIYWRSFDFSAGGSVDEGGSIYVDWSPDGKALAYEKDNEIRVFSMASHTSKAIAAGHFPSWSPDGASIAFQAPDNHVSLVSPTGTPLHWPLEGLLTKGPVQWSPKGQFVSLSAPSDTHFLIFGGDARLLVCRAVDGACVSVRDLSGFKRPAWFGFYWIEHYREFCRTCRRGDP